MTELEGSDPDDRVAKHLAECRYCMAVYAELVRARARFSLQPDSDRPPAALLEIAKGIPSSAKARRARAAAWRDGRHVAPALAAMAVGVALLVVLRGTGFEPWRGVPPGLQRSISERLREDSHGGLLYASDLLPHARGVRGGEGDAKDPDLGPLMQAYAAHPQSAEVAYWLIAGLLGWNQLRDADPYLRESLQRFPDDARFHNLAAILAYKKSDLPTAEGELSSALAIQRDAAALVNLAQVLQEQERAAEAQTLLSEVLWRFPHAQVANLARERAAP
jgi:tetratricopeptide (TPR) repeat protein